VSPTIHPVDSHEFGQLCDAGNTGRRLKVNQPKVLSLVRSKFTQRPRIDLLKFDGLRVPFLNRPLGRFTLVSPLCGTTKDTRLWHGAWSARKQIVDCVLRVVRFRGIDVRVINATIVTKSSLFIKNENMWCR
jgi:hypothetical protein